MGLFKKISKEARRVQKKAGKAVTQAQSKASKAVSQAQKKAKKLQSKKGPNLKGMDFSNPGAGFRSMGKLEDEIDRLIQDSPIADPLTKQSHGLARKNVRRITQAEGGLMDTTAVAAGDPDPFGRRQRKRDKAIQQFRERTGGTGEGSGSGDFSGRPSLGTALEAARTSVGGRTRSAEIIRDARGKRGAFGSVGSLIGLVVGGYFGAPTAGAAVGGAAGGALSGVNPNVGQSQNQAQNQQIISTLGSQLGSYGFNKPQQQTDIPNQGSQQINPFGVGDFGAGGFGSQGGGYA